MNLIERTTKINIRSLTSLALSVGFILGALFVTAIFWEKETVKFVPFAEKIVKVGDAFRCVSEPIQLFGGGHWFVFLHVRGSTYVVQFKEKPPKKGVLIRGSRPKENIFHPLEE